MEQPSGRGPAGRHRHLPLEHLLQHHFEAVFPRVERLVGADALFADMFARCAAFGQSWTPENHHRFSALQRRV